MTRFRRSGVNWEGRSWVTSPALNPLMDEIEARYPDRHPADGTVASERHDQNNPTSDHRPFPYIGPGVVNAVDTGETVEGQGEELFQALLASQDGRIRYVIHENRLFSSYTSSTGIPPWTIRPGVGHLDHVHVSVLRGFQDDGRPWRLFEEDGMTPEQEAKLDHAIDLIEAVPQGVMGYWLRDPQGVPPGEQGNPLDSPAIHYNTIFRKMRSDLIATKAMVEALDIEGVSEEELDERVDHLLALLPDRTVDRIRDRLATPA